MLLKSHYHTGVEMTSEDKLGAWMDEQRGRIISTKARVDHVVLNVFGICYMLPVCLSVSRYLSPEVGDLSGAFMYLR